MNFMVRFLILFTSLTFNRIAMKQNPPPPPDDLLFDVAPFALPNAPANEIWFEQPRDIVRIKVQFKGSPPEDLGLSYRQKHWPYNRLEIMETDRFPIKFGWAPQDDWFTSQWKKAAITTTSAGPDALWITFQNLAHEEFANFDPHEKHYDVTYRRTLALKIDTPDLEQISSIAVFTISPPVRTVLNVRFDIGAKTFDTSMRLTGYNVIMENITTIDRSCSDNPLQIVVRRMVPRHKYSGDDGLVTFHTEDGAFTVSLTSLDKQGPIWFPQKGVFITNADDPTTFDQYQDRIQKTKTIAQRVKSAPNEQSRYDSFIHQPRPHAVKFNIGCALAAQKFMIHQCGDLVMPKRLFNRECIGGKNRQRLKINMADANSHFNGARVSFGRMRMRCLDNWHILAKFPDPEPVLVYNIHARQHGVFLHQKFIAVPLFTPIHGDWNCDDPMVAMARLQFKNKGYHTENIEFPLAYSQVADVKYDDIADIYAKSFDAGYDDLFLDGNRVLSPFEEKYYLRFAVQTDMQMRAEGKAVILHQNLAPGQSCTAVVKVPYLTLEHPNEFEAIDNLGFEKAYPQVSTYWHQTARRGAVIQTPEPALETLHTTHLSHVLLSDFARPSEPELINTCIGTYCYADYPNESCMIVHDLDERGLHDDAQRRLAVWLKYQSSVALTGNFTDYNGLFQGSGGFEHGFYNQNHGFVMWCLAEHYFFTHDKEWLHSIAQNLIDATDWITRQRRQTMTSLPHSRGWEYGFLPAGSLEDVQDYSYWLATNVLTWRGLEWAARALEDIQHHQASRIRKEADAYKKDLTRGFEISCRHSPLVRLRNGCWVPHYPSRLYLRGRDVGWGRETLESAVYLLISGLYDSDSPQAQWILDDFHDNRLTRPPYGFLIPHFEQQWFSHGGISMQPFLLPGLIPYLDRDEPEIYIWMFYNNFNAVYRDEINAICEHPFPILGSDGDVFKPSDEANGTAWIRYMFVYTHPRQSLLHLGRAIPDHWFQQSQPFFARNVTTRFGTVSICYQPDPQSYSVTADIDFNSVRTPESFLLRFRLPDQKKIHTVWLNEKEWSDFDPQKGDINLTRQQGQIHIRILYD